MVVGWFFLTSVVLLHFLEVQPLPDRKTDWNCLSEASLCGYASSDLVRESILPIYQLHQLASRIRHIAPSPRGRKYYTSRIRYYANSDSTFHHASPYKRRCLHPDRIHPKIRRKVLNLNSPVSLLTQGVLLISDSN